MIPQPRSGQWQNHSEFLYESFLTSPEFHFETASFFMADGFIYRGGPPLESGQLFQLN